MKTTSTNCKIVGIGVCGPNEKYLEATLKEFKRLCDDVIIVGNNTDEASEKLIKSYGFWFYRDDREWGIHQPTIKTDLLTKAGSLKPDWIIALDMDELFAPEFDRSEAERLASGHEVAYYFTIINLYNDEEHYTHGTGIQRFQNIRFYKYMPEYGLVFQKKNLHCGLGPPITYGYGWNAPYYVAHYGLMSKEDRERKAQRYDKYDPNAKFKGKEYYEALRSEHKAVPFDRQGLLRKLKEDKACQPRNKINLPKL